MLSNNGGTSCTSNGKLLRLSSPIAPSLHLAAVTSAASNSNPSPSPNPIVNAFGSSVEGNHHTTTVTAFTAVIPRTDSAMSLLGEFSRRDAVSEPIVRMRRKRPHPADSGSSVASSLCANRPSEALFIQCLIHHCKRITPLWFHGVSTLREKNREHNRRAHNGTGAWGQDQWQEIADNIHNVDPTSESETVMNLLKKLHKELKPDAVLWLMKCWLRLPETQHDDKCVLTRGDAKDRMRRVDGGKGSDKVWRLDTLVGMLYHGLPLSSTDTHLLKHTCDQDLCVRPQHLRFRANAVSLVIVLKALQQAGYEIHPPNTTTPSKSGQTPMRFEEDSVEVSGPFNIEELQKFWKEDLQPPTDVLQRLHLTVTDKLLMQELPWLKANCESAVALSGGGPPPHWLLHHSTTPNSVKQEAWSGGSGKSERMETVQALLTLSSTALRANSLVVPTAMRTSAFSPVVVHSSPVTTPGRITPRQPAKKRLEARTPTLEIDERFSPYEPAQSGAIVSHVNDVAVPTRLLPLTEMYNSMEDQELRDILMLKESAGQSEMNS